MIAQKRNMTVLLSAAGHGVLPGSLFLYFSRQSTGEGAMCIQPRSLLTLVGCSCLLVCAWPALAHHGTGLFDVTTDVHWSGTLTEMEFVNPHSYMHFEIAGSDGQPFAMRCEMRAAMLLRRSGWELDKFVAGSRVEIDGHPHRTDPHACYLESFTLNQETTLGRNDQLSSAAPLTLPAERAARLPTGEPNISGDWAVEQAVLTAPPGGGRGDMIPRSLREEYSSGSMTLQQIRALTPTPVPVYTALGRQEADAFQMWSVEDNPRLSCKPTSILYDWTFDWPVNRIVQFVDNGARVIDIDYGLYNFKRRIHLDLDAHPSDLAPSPFGHSLGHWDGDTLVVDTVGFAAGVLAPPTLSSEQLHIVERFTLDTEGGALRRDYVASDPVYLAEPYAGFDTVFVSETPYVYEGCKEMTPEFTNQVSE
jgi:hypothetical protein